MSYETIRAFTASFSVLLSVSTTDAARRLWAYYMPSLCALPDMFVLTGKRHTRGNLCNNTAIKLSHTLHVCSHRLSEYLSERTSQKIYICTSMYDIRYVVQHSPFAVTALILTNYNNVDASNKHATFTGLLEVGYSVIYT